MKKRVFIGLLFITLCIFSCANISADNSGNISGIIVNDDYEPIADVIIKVISGPTLFRTTSNSNGEYILENLAPGIYEIEISSSTYYVSQQISGISVTADKNTSISIVLKSQPLNPGSISGKTFDNSNKNLSNVLVQIISETTSKSILTDSLGEYNFKDVNPGKYDIYFSKDGYISKRLIDVQVNNGQDRNNIDAILQIQTGEISGVITNLQGTIISDATIKILEDPTKIVYTNENGEYRFIDLNPGTYTLEISSSGYISFKLSNVSVLPGRVNSDVNVALELPRGSITGNIYNQNGSLLIGAKVEILEGSTKKSAIVDSYGYYILQDLIPGTYTLEVSFSGYSKQLISNVVVSSAKETFNTNTTITSIFGSVSGVITSASNKVPIADAILEIIGNSGVSIKTTPDGSYKFSNLNPGLYTIRIIKSGYETTLMSNVTVEAGKDVNIDYSLNPLVSLSGFIYSHSGLPLNGATVTITDGKVEKSMTAGSGGIFRFSDLPSGTYSITVTCQGYIPYRQNNIMIDSAKDISGIRIELDSQYGSISGKVSSAKDNSSLRGSTITITGPITKSLVSDLNGNYMIDNLPPGIYIVTASQTNFGTKQISNVKVEAGQNIDVNFLLEERGSISGRIFAPQSLLVNAPASYLVGVIVEISGPMEKTFEITNYNQSFSFGSGNNVSYSISDLDPGTYKITVKPSTALKQLRSLDNIESTIVIESGKNTVKDFQF